MRTVRTFAIGCFLALSLTVSARAAAPELYDIKDFVVEYARFDDFKASEKCGLSRETVSGAINKALTGTSVPFAFASESKPPMMGVVRAQLIPEIYTHVGETLDCISWVSLSAESKANTIIPPSSSVRSITAVYWRGHTKIASGQSIHAQRVGEVIEKMAATFAQQYRLDQPPEIK